MASLTEIAHYARIIIKWGSILLIFFIVGRIVFNFSKDLYRQLNPPPPPPPTLTFGKLPALQFPNQEKEAIQFNLETPTGTFPDASDRAIVYFMPPTRPSLLAPDKAREQATVLGFTEEPAVLSDRIFRWIKKTDAKHTLEMDIISGKFELTYDWPSDPYILLERNLPGQEQVKNEALNFLQRINTNMEDLTDGEMKVTYLKASLGNYVEAESLSEANFVRVDMFRRNYDDLPVMTPDPNVGIVTIIFSGSTNYQKRIIKVNFNYYPVKEDTFGTYYIKTPMQAWEELKAGQGYIAGWDGQNKNISIRRIYFAYYDSLELQDFLQPILVFEGDHGFYGYIPMVSSEWTL